MPRYWVYLNGQVQGPYEIEKLIRVPGFSRQTQVSVDDMSGTAGKWISPADIPELARIFQKVDEIHDAPAPAPKPAAKPKPKMPARLTPVAPPVPEPDKFSWAWLWIILAVVLAGGGLFQWVRISQRQQHAEERQNARAMIEMAPLPSTSVYSTLRQYLQAKQIATRWEYERSSDGIYHVAVSWAPQTPGEPLPVYSFEVNLPVQSVRGLNTAATKLLAEGFPAPHVPKAKEAEKPKKSPGDFFPGAINDRRQAFEQGDFDTVWEMFSRRRKTEMQQGGINAAGFTRMQKLTYRPDAAVQQTIVKTRNDSETIRLVLVRQSQPKHPDIFIKQRWVWEDESWRLDDEEKKVAAAASSADTPQSESPSAAPSSEPPQRPAGMPNLPGLSDSPSR
jgi:hypothetical protein